MIIFIILLIVIVLIFFGLKESSKTDDEYALENGCKLYFRSDFRYIGGIKNKIITNENSRFCYFICKDDDFMLTNRIGDIITSFKRDDILEVLIENQNEIERKVSLGKVALFGVFALAMPSNKESVRNFVVIRFKKDNEEISLILEPYSDGLCNNVNEVVNKFKYIKIMN